MLAFDVIYAHKVEGWRTLDLLCGKFVCKWRLMSPQKHVFGNLKWFTLHLCNLQQHHHHHLFVFAIFEWFIFNIFSRIKTNKYVYILIFRWFVWLYVFAFHIITLFLLYLFFPVFPIYMHSDRAFGLASFECNLYEQIYFFRTYILMYCSFFLFI
jgi:hypothetical protein